MFGFGRTWKIGSVGGVAIRVDSSWAVIAVLVTYSLWIQFTAPGYDMSDGAAAGLAFFAAGLFFGSVLLHELAHAGMARARGIPVSGITLFLFGGATSARVEDKGPVDEFLVTVVGPGSSFALAGIFWVLSRAVGAPVDVALRYVAGVNLLLAVFNVIPGFPLDGGRILRSIVWRVTGSLDRATMVAATGGQIVGGLMIAGGLADAFADDVVRGLWLAMIGYFLFQAARGAVQQQRLRAVLARAVVADAMRPPPRVIPASMSLSESLDAYLRGHEEEAFPVVDGDRVIGLLTFESAGRVGRHDPLRPVREAMLPLSEIPTARLDEPLDAVSDRLAGRSALVLSDGRLVGSLTPEDVGRWLVAHRVR